MRDGLCLNCASGHASILDPHLHAQDLILPVKISPTFQTDNQRSKHTRKLATKGGNHTNLSFLINKIPCDSNLNGWNLVEIQKQYSFIYFI